MHINGNGNTGLPTSTDLSVFYDFTPQNTGVRFKQQILRILDNLQNPLIIPINLA